MIPDPTGRLTRRDDLRTLGLPPSASSEEVLRAYLKLRRALRKDSPAMRSAANETERCEMLQRIEEAYRRLCSQTGQSLYAGDTATTDPPLDMRSRPSPFRARPSRPRS
jgi:curved DNA-binding protein CbpA